MSRLSFRGRRTLHAVLMVPFVLPTVVVGSAFLAFLGPQSPLNTISTGLFGDGAFTVDLRRTVTAILIAHVFFNYAVVVRTVGGLWSMIDPKMEDAARVLGASRWRAFTEVTLPLLKPAIASAASIVFLFTFTSFGVVLILGGAARATLEVEIHRATTQLLDLPLASALALLQLAAVVAALAVYGYLQRRTPTGTSLVSSAATRRRPTTTGSRLFLGANLAVMVVLIIAPMVVLVERSLSTPDGYSLANYVALTEPGDSVLAVSAGEAIWNSVMFGALAAVLALIVGAVAASAASGGGGSARIVDRALMLPLGTSAVTVGFGFLLAFGPPLNWRASPWLVPIAQALIAIPFVVRTLLPVLSSIDTRLREAAATLGATPLRVWREVDLPLVARAMAVALGFSFAIAVGEFGATVFVARASHPTMPVAIFRLLGQPGATNFGQAMAMSSLLMLVTASAMLAIDRVRVGNVGRF